MFRRLRRLLGPTEPCQACITKDSEIQWLRQRHDLLLDRILATAGQLQATTEALSVPQFPDRDDNSAPDEPDPDTFDQEALKEQKAWAEANGVPISATHDA